MTADHTHDPHNHEIHHAESLDDVAAARVAVVEAKAEMHGLKLMLRRHYRLGVYALAIAALYGLGTMLVIDGLRDVIHAHGADGDRTELQTRINEVEVLRHRVHEREGHQKLCEIALGASRSPEIAKRICLPILGADYDKLKAQLELDERSLEELRASQ